MTSVSEFILSYVVNACWQIAAIAVVAAAGSYLLRNAPARYLHVLWLAALGLCVAVPLLTATHTGPTNQSLPHASVSDPQISLGRVDTEPDIPVSYLTKRRTQAVNANPDIVLWLTLAYALFIAWRAIRLVRFWVRKERLRRSAIDTDLPRGVEQVAQRCCTALGLTNVRIARSSTVRVPYTLGARRPLIVLPEVFCSADEEQLVSVIGHELAHVARRDYLTNFICEVVTLSVSFHPVIFLIKKEIDRARELACDELVSKRLLPPKLYARSLVWAADVSSQARSQALMLSMFDARSLEERVMRLTRNQRILSRSMAKAIMSITLFALCAAAVALSLFSFELKTEARALFMPTARSFNNNAPTASTETATTQHPRPELQQPVAKPQQPGAENRLDAPNAQQRAEAACEAGRSGDTEKIPTLFAMFGDDARTQPIRCWTIGRWSPALDTFKHPSPGEQAAIALASMGRVAFQPLTNQLESTNATVRRNAAWAIGELTNMPPGERDGAVPRLITLLTDGDEWVRMAAARALGEVNNRSAVPALIATLSDNDAHVRELVTWALSELKDKRAVAALCSVLLSDARAEVRRGAAEALGEIASAEALPSLKQALNDPAVSAKAEWAISEIEG